MGALRIKVGDCEASVQFEINKRHLESYWRRQIPTHLIYWLWSRVLTQQTVLYCLAFFGLGSVTSKLYQRTWLELSQSQLDLKWLVNWVQPSQVLQLLKVSPQTQSRCQLWKDPGVDYLLSAHYSLRNMLSEQMGRNLVQKEQSRKISKEMLTDTQHTQHSTNCSNTLLEVTGQLTCVHAKSL